MTINESSLYSVVVTVFPTLHKKANTHMDMCASTDVRGGGLNEGG